MRPQRGRLTIRLTSRRHRPCELTVGRVMRSGIPDCRRRAGIHQPRSDMDAGQVPAVIEDRMVCAQMKDSGTPGWGCSTSAPRQPTRSPHHEMTAARTEPQLGARGWPWVVLAAEPAADRRADGGGVDRSGRASVSAAAVCLTGIVGFVGLGHPANGQAAGSARRAASLRGATLPVAAPRRVGRSGIASWALKRARARRCGGDASDRSGDSPPSRERADGGAVVAKSDRAR